MEEKQRIMDEILSTTYTNEEIRKTVEKETKKFMNSVKKFLKVKGGGEIPDEWGASLMLLESYFRQFRELDIQISQLPSLIVKGRFGLTPSPLLACRDKASVRLESMMKEMGLTMNTGKRLGTTEVKKATTPIEEFMKAELDK